MSRRRVFLLVALGLLLVPAGRIVFDMITYPTSYSPEGAYFRVVSAVNNRRPERAFPYTETAAQHACYTIRDYRRQARERILAAYPTGEGDAWLAAHGEEALAPDGADVFAIYARRHAWLDLLRRDLSGVAEVTVEGDRATVQTVRGTRYSFRRRENGIWGLTQFTAVLVAEAEKAARDAGMIERAAADYERVRAHAAASGAVPVAPR